MRVTRVLLWTVPSWDNLMVTVMEVFMTGFLREEPRHRTRRRTLTSWLMTSLHHSKLHIHHRLILYRRPKVGKNWLSDPIDCEVGHFETVYCVIIRPLVSSLRSVYGLLQHYFASKFSCCDSGAVSWAASSWGLSVLRFVTVVTFYDDK